MLQRYLGVPLRLPQPARGSAARSWLAWLYSRPGLGRRHPELQLGVGCDVPAPTALPWLRPGWQSSQIPLATVFVQIKESRCSRHPWPT